MTRTVPLPLNVAEIKIQPSLGRVNLNGSLDFEIEDTASNSETRLFSLLSPVNRIAASAASARPQMKMMNRAISLALISDTSNGWQRLSSRREVTPPQCSKDACRCGEKS